MLSPTTPEVLRHRRLIVAGTVLTVLLIIFVTYAMLIHRSAATSAEHADNATSTPSAARNRTQQAANELATLRPTSRPETFARMVAEALFAWDTSTLVSRTDHIELLVAAGDPTGESTPGLVADLDNYLPSQNAWVELAQYETKQWLSINSVSTPTRWSEAKTQAGEQLLPGTAAFTIRGARHRSGVWEGAPVNSEHDVAFTVFIVCTPSYPECHLLRLSILDKPLD